MLDDFEAGSETVPDGWAAVQWIAGASTLGKTVDPDDECNRVATIASTGSANDARWERSFTLAPRAYYSLTGRVRTKSVSGGYGAGFGLADTWDVCPGVSGTAVWTDCAFTIGGGATGSVTLDACLGYTAAESTGTAWFDDLQLVRLQSTAGSHLRAMLEPNDASLLEPTALDGWLQRADQAYETLYGLVGAAPAAGGSLDVVSIRQPASSAQEICAEAVCWPRARVVPDVERAAVGGAWNYDTLLGLSGLFDLDGRWVWSADFFAALKAYHVVETLDAVVMPSEDPDWTFQGSDLVEFYRDQMTTSVGLPDLIVHFIEFSDAIGWEPFQDAFDYFRGLDPENVPTGYQRFDTFVKQLELSSGADLLVTFTTAEFQYVVGVTEPGML